MIKHIVFWRIREELAAEAPQRLAEIRTQLEALVGVIPGLVHLELGTDFSESAASFDVALYSVFENREALAGYMGHPDHVAVVGMALELFEERAVVDYEL